MQQIKLNQIKETRWQEEVQAVHSMGNANKAELEEAQNTMVVLSQQLHEKDQQTENMKNAHKTEMSHLEQQARLSPTTPPQTNCH